MSNKHYEVAELIMDEAALEYRNDNLSSIEAVQQAAEGGLEIYLDKNEAQKILEICLAMDKRIDEGEIPSQSSWNHDYKEKLMAI